MKRIVLALSLAGVMMAGACTPSMMRHAVGAAIITAAIVGSVQMMSYHDAHYHDGYCGHSRRYHDGRYVYYYNDRWEYYDPYERSWYFYAD